MAIDEYKKGRTAIPSLTHEASMAERVGFEPTVPVTVHTLSRRAPSTTRAPLRHNPSKDISAMDYTSIISSSLRLRRISIFLIELSVIS